MDYYIKVHKQINRWKDIRPVLENKDRVPLINSRPNTPTRRLLTKTKRGTNSSQIHSACPNTPKSPDRSFNFRRGSVKQNLNITQQPDAIESLTQATEFEAKNSSSDKTACIRGENTELKQKIEALKTKYSLARDINVKLSKDIMSLKANIAEIAEVFCKYIASCEKS